LLAQTPDRRTMAGPDLLSELLKVVRVSGSVFLNGRFSAPFGVISPKVHDEGTPLARLRHVSILHLVVEGACALETATGERRELAAGDMVFLPFADRHRFWTGEPEHWALAGDIMRPGPIEGMSKVDHGGGGEQTRFVCGFIESAEFLFAPVFRTLPTLLVERTSDDKIGAFVASAVREIVALVDAATPGTQAVLGRLMELLFVEVLRRHIARLPEGSKGWFAALNDPVVGRALQLLHADPARRWTIDEIALKVGSSRTVLAGRFKALLGRPPIDYLASWRIQLASERLRLGHESVSSIAASVGYESEAAFTRAFKRISGVTPGSRREAKGAAMS